MRSVSHDSPHENHVNLESEIVNHLMMDGRREGERDAAAAQDPSAA